MQQFIFLLVIYFSHVVYTQYFLQTPEIYIKFEVFWNRDLAVFICFMSQVSCFLFIWFLEGFGIQLKASQLK